MEMIGFKTRGMGSAMASRSASSPARTALAYPRASCEASCKKSPEDHAKTIFFAGKIKMHFLCEKNIFAFSTERSARTGGASRPPDLRQPSDGHAVLPVAYYSLARRGQF